jgi:hypothetical protein
MVSFLIRRTGRHVPLPHYRALAWSNKGRVQGIKIAMKPGVAPVVSEVDRNILTVKEALEVLQKVTKQISKEMQEYA